MYINIVDFSSAYCGTNQRFGKIGKLSPRFIGPYEVIEKAGPVAYRLTLPPELEKIHNVFHVSMLEEPVEILAREVKELRNKKIPLVKVLWRNYKTEEATWESEETMQQQYPQLFNEGNFDDEIFLSEGEL